MIVETLKEFIQCNTCGAEFHVQSMFEDESDIEEEVAFCPYCGDYLGEAVDDDAWLAEVGE